MGGAGEKGMGRGAGCRDVDYAGLRESEQAGAQGATELEGDGGVPVGELGGLLLF